MRVLETFFSHTICKHLLHISWQLPLNPLWSSATLISQAGTRNASLLQDYLFFSSLKKQQLGSSSHLTTCSNLLAVCHCVTVQLQKLQTETDHTEQVYISGGSQKGLNVLLRRISDMLKVSNEVCEQCYKVFLVHTHSSKGSALQHIYISSKCAWKQRRCGKVEQMFHMSFKGKLN